MSCSSLLPNYQPPLQAHGEVAHAFNSPFPSCSQPFFQPEAKCKTFIWMLVLFACVHMNGFSLSVSLKSRLQATWKWAIAVGLTLVSSCAFISHSSYYMPLIFTLLYCYCSLTHLTLKCAAREPLVPKVLQTSTCLFSVS